MAKYQFRGTPRATGLSYVVTIPKAYVENGLVKDGTEYEFSVEVPDA